MAKKNAKELVKKPDVLLATIERTYVYIRNNLKLFVIGVIIFLAAVVSAYGYTIYARNQEEKAQQTLFQGIRSFEEFGRTGNQDSLASAENTFLTLVREKRGKAFHTARLYLATIHRTKGETEEAKALYRDVIKDSPGTLLRALAEQALQGLEKK